MITRACISINNRCNLNCVYCHFNEKQNYISEKEMDIYKILNNIKEYISKYNINLFKIGFVGNGEALLDYDDLVSYILYLKEEIKNKKISVYIITNGTLINEEKLKFFKEYEINLSFSIDGFKYIHDKLRCNSFNTVMSSIRLYKKINGIYPPMNCTVGKEIIEQTNRTILFFKYFQNRITFSRMIGKYGISINEFNKFLDIAKKHLNIRTGKYDCTMYGGKCAAGIDNLYYSNGNIYICGNCIDISNNINYNTYLDEIDFKINEFNRNFCYKEINKI